MPINIVVPEVGESIVDARVARWLKKAGEPVAAGEALVELETDKVDVEVAAPKAGVLQTIAHGDGADVKIGDVLGRSTRSDGYDARYERGHGRTAETRYDGDDGPRRTAETQARTGTTGYAAATPSARKLAREQKVDLNDVKAIRPARDEGGRRERSRVRRTAVRLSRPRATSNPPQRRQRPSPCPLALPPCPAYLRTRRRLKSACGCPNAARRSRGAWSKRSRPRRMLTTFNEVDMSAVMSLRERQKEAFKAKHGISLGIASFFVKAAVAALKEFPRLNAEIQGDEMVLKHYYDIGVAVGAAEGLVVPVLRGADRMSFAEIEGGIREFAAKAKDGTLTLEDLRGGTFSITNGGVYGSLMSTPILNPPQVGILGLHAIKERPVGVNGQVVLRPMMYTALTYDHRIVDGSEAVRFLVRVKELVEDPGVPAGPFVTTEITEKTEATEKNAPTKSST